MLLGVVLQRSLEGFELVLRDAEGGELGARAVPVGVRVERDVLAHVTAGCGDDVVITDDVHQKRALDRFGADGCGARRRLAGVGSLSLDPPGSSGGSVRL